MGFKFEKEEKKETIFVQIASYRDPELLPTLRDLFDKAKYPDNLHVCVAWQHSEEDKWDNLDEFKNDTRLTIIDIAHTDAKSACWARNLIQQKYNNETYTLQLDSHHRFVENWDEECITMLKGLMNQGYDKPLLTSYIPSYNPEKDPDGRVNVPWGMSFDRFTPEGIVFFLPYYMNEKNLYPIKARFFSAHFAFTLGQHAVEVQHDPEYYFHGEEITLAVRSFTHGYDLFHPNKVIAWHEYTRKGRVKQWDDDRTWGQKNKDCHRKVRSLLGVDNEDDIKEEKYGLGKVRTLKEYEVYSGIRFSDRAITTKCKNNGLPPGTEEDPFNDEFKHPINLSNSQFSKDDYNFAAVILQDDKAQELHREDVIGFQDLLKQKDFQIWVKANVPKPNNIIVWAHSLKDGWAEKIHIPL